MKYLVTNGIVCGFWSKTPKEIEYRRDKVGNKTAPSNDKYASNIGRCNKCGAKFLNPSQQIKGVGGILQVCPNCESIDWNVISYRMIGKCNKCSAKFSTPSREIKPIAGVLLVCPNCGSIDWD